MSIAKAPAAPSDRICEKQKHGNSVTDALISAKIASKIKETHLEFVLPFSAKNASSLGRALQLS